MKTVLFVVNHSAQLISPLKLILLLKDNPKYRPLVYLNFSGGWNLWKEIEICQRHCISFICDAEGKELVMKKGMAKGSEADHPYFAPPTNETTKSVKNEVKSFLLDYFSIIVNIRFLNRKVNELSGTLRVNKVDIVILPEDAYGIHPLFNKAAKKNKIPTVLIPFTKSNYLEVLDIYPIRRISGLSRVYCGLFKKWKRAHKGGYYMPLPLKGILALDLARVSPVSPFVLMGGRSDLMLIENEEDVHYYRDAGISLQKMIKTGAMYQDTFCRVLSNYETLKAELYRKYDIMSTKPVILCTLFPVATPVKERYDINDYGIVENAISFWLKPLLECDKFQLWIVHHPRTNLDFVKYLEKWNLKVIYEATETVLPFCDLHVAGTSATTRMSLTLGKPILCYTDNVVFTDLERYGGTVTVKTKEEYRNITAKLKADFSFFERLKMEAVKNMKQFGPLDGKAAERILKVFDSVTK